MLLVTSLLLVPPPSTTSEVQSIPPTGLAGLGVGSDPAGRSVGSGPFGRLKRSGFQEFEHPGLEVKLQYICGSARNLPHCRMGWCLLYANVCKCANCQGKSPLAESVFAVALDPKPVLLSKMEQAALVMPKSVLCIQSSVGTYECMSKKIKPCKL